MPTFTWTARCGDSPVTTERQLIRSGRNPSCVRAACPCGDRGGRRVRHHRWGSLRRGPRRLPDGNVLPAPAPRLSEADVHVVIAYGNHDAANEITKRLTLPEGVHAFPHDAAGTVELKDVGVALHGRSYANRAVFEDLSLATPGRSKTCSTSVYCTHRSMADQDTTLTHPARWTG